MKFKKTSPRVFKSGFDAVGYALPWGESTYGRDREEPAAGRDEALQGMKPIHLRARTWSARGLRFLSSGLVLK